ncbi:MAG: histidine kinase, partial [Bacteroidota bacterium]
MQKTKRALIQTISWALIWMVLWLTQDGNERFIIDNIAAFLFQILLITILIWYVAPKLLFQRKYFIFVLVSILIVGISAYLSSNILSGPPPFRGPRGRGPRAPLPSKFFVQLLLIGVSYIIATLLETFLFAQRKEEETIRNKNENLQTELKLLKSQINPHFLFNALNNIYALSTMDSTKTQESISYLSDMLR